MRSRPEGPERVGNALDGALELPHARRVLRGLDGHVAPLLRAQGAVGSQAGLSGAHAATNRLELECVEQKLDVRLGGVGARRVDRARAHQL